MDLSAAMINLFNLRLHVRSLWKESYHASPVLSRWHSTQQVVFGHRSHPLLELQKSMRVAEYHVARANRFGNGHARDRYLYLQILDPVFQ